MALWQTLSDANGNDFWVTWEGTGPTVDPTDVVWHGAVTQSSFVVVAEPASNGDLQLEVSDVSDFSNIIFSNIGSGSQGNPVRWEITGLSPDTQYWWRVSGSSTTVEGSLTTFPDPATDPDVTICFASCSNANYGGGSNAGTSNSPAFERIENTAPELFVHLGDMHYDDNETTDLSVHRASLRNVLGTPRQQSLYRSVPLGYVNDDHEWGPNNADSTDTGRNAWLETYRDFVPHYALASTNATDHIGHAFDIGRCRVILIDNRSDRDPQDSSDSTISMLGTQQKNWLQNELQNFSQQYLIFASVVPWLGSADSTDSTFENDAWPGYSDERAEIAQMIDDNGLTDSTVIIAGDMHNSAFGAPAANTYGPWTDGPPVLQAAPLGHDSLTIKGGPYQLGPVNDGHKAQYGQIEIVDKGGSADVTYRAFSVQDGSTDTEEFSTTQTLDAAGVSLAVSTDSATNIDTSSAALNGVLDDLGGAADADCNFQWREVGASTWNETSAQTLSSTGGFSDTISGLAEGTDYEFRAKADDGTNIVTGSTLTFTTDTSTGEITFTGANAVEDGNGDPVQNATVYAVKLGESNTPQSATTDANGEATISGLDSSTIYRTWAEKDLDGDNENETTQVIIRTSS